MAGFDFGTASFDELDQHAMESLVFDTGEVSPILNGHLFVERIIETLLSRHLLDPDALLKKTRIGFELKVDLARALGLLPPKYVSAFKALNNVRNKYAHRPDYKVTFEELTGFKFDWEPIQEEAYRGACTKGVEEAALIATIFLCWKAIHLIKDAEA